MVRSASQRASKYAAKNDPEVIKQRFEAQKESMNEQAEARFSELAELEDQAKSILETEGVGAIDIPFYLSWCRQLYKLDRDHLAGTAENEAEAYGAVWVDRGLDVETLETLADNLFDFNVDLGGA